MKNGDGDPRSSPAGLSIDHTAADGIRMVTLLGEIDHAITEELTEALLSYGSVTPPRTMVDLSGVTFMDSSGISALIAADQGMSDAQGAAYRRRPGISAAGP